MQLTDVQISGEVVFENLAAAWALGNTLSRLIAAYMYICFLGSTTTLSPHTNMGEYPINNLWSCVSLDPFKALAQNGMTSSLNPSEESPRTRVSMTQPAAERNNVNTIFATSSQMNFSILFCESLCPLRFTAFQLICLLPLRSARTKQSVTECNPFFME